MTLMMDSRDEESFVINLDKLDAYFENHGDHEFYMTNRIEPIVVKIKNKELSKKIKDEVLKQFKEHWKYDTGK